MYHVYCKGLTVNKSFITRDSMSVPSICDELSNGTKIDDLERPWTPKRGFICKLFAISGSNTHFNGQLRRNGFS